MSANKIPLYISAEFGDLDYVKECLALGMKANVYAPNGDYPLHAAARGKNPAMLKLILDAYPEAVNNSGHDGCYALHEVFRNRCPAVRDNIYKCCEILLGAGANVNKRNDNGWLPFAWALDMKDYPICALLIRHGADSTSFRLSSLDWFREADEKAHIEARQKQAEADEKAYKEAMQKRAEEKTQEEKKQAEEKAREEKKQADQKRQESAAESKTMADDHVNPVLPCARCSPESHTLPLFCAIINGHVACLKAILKSHPGEIKKGNAAGHTCLHMAVYHEREEFIKPLVDAGADLKVVDWYSRTALDLAIYREHDGMIRALISCGAKVTPAIQVRIDKMRLHNSKEVDAEKKCAKKVSTEVAKSPTLVETEATKKGIKSSEPTLEERIADISHFVPFDQVKPTTCDQCSSLCRALYFGHRSCFQTILKFHPEEVGTRNSERDTCLHEAVRYSRFEYIKYLVDAGAALEAPGTVPHGTPLEYAIRLKHVLSARVLIDCGAIIPTSISSGDKQWLEENCPKSVNSSPTPTSGTSTEERVTTPVSTTTATATKDKEVENKEEVDDFSERCRAELMRYWCKTIDDALHKAAFIDHKDYVEITVVGARLRARLVKLYQKRRFCAETSDEDSCQSIIFSCTPEE